MYIKVRHKTIYHDVRNIDQLNTQTIVNKIRFNSCCLEANLPRP